MYCTLPAGYYHLNMFNQEYLLQWKSTQQFMEDYLKAKSMTEKQYFNFKFWNTFRQQLQRDFSYSFLTNIHTLHILVKLLKLEIDTETILLTKFQNLQWIPGTMNIAELYTYYVFSKAHIPLVKFNL